MTGAVERGALMGEEIATIPDIVAAQLCEHLAAYLALGQGWRKDPPLFFATCARGTSDQAALFFKYLTEIGTGIPVVSLGPSLGTLFRAPLRLKGSVTLAISQSGASPDLVGLIESAKAGGSATVALVNTLPSPLAEASGQALPLGAGPERAVAATKSFVASLVAVSTLCAGQTGDQRLLTSLHDLPKVLRLCRASPGQSLDAFARADHVFCLGRGLGLAVAGEAALKLKETCLIAAEGLSATEFRHGPIVLAKPGTAALIFLTDDETRLGSEDLAQTLKDRGATVMTFGTGAADLQMPTTGHPVTDMIAAITFFYDLAWRLSVAKGLNPDTPPHLSKATLTV